MHFRTRKLPECHVPLQSPSSHLPPALQTPSDVADEQTFSFAAFYKKYFDGFIN